MSEQREIKIVGDNPHAVGQRVTLALEPSDVHDPTELPTYLAGYRPFMYRAEEMSMPILVDNDQDKFRNFNSDDAFRRVDVKGSTQGATPEVDPSTTLNTYKVEERYIGSFVPKQTELQTGNNYRPIMAAARRCKRALMLDHEIDVCSLLGTIAGWDASVQTPAANTWDSLTGTPIADVQTAVEASSQPVTEVWMNQKVAHAFLRNANVRDQMRQMYGDDNVQRIGEAVNSAGQFDRAADFFIPGLPPIKVVASKVLNETTGALDYCLPDVAVLLTKPPGVPDDGEEIATSYTWRRRGPSGTGIEVREFFVEQRGPHGGTMIVVATADIPMFTANNAGGIITGVHS